MTTVHSKYFLAHAKRFLTDFVWTQSNMCMKESQKTPSLPVWWTCKICSRRWKSCKVILALSRSTSLELLPPHGGSKLFSNSPMLILYRVRGKSLSMAAMLKILWNDPDVLLPRVLSYEETVCASSFSLRLLLLDFF